MVALVAGIGLALSLGSSRVHLRSLFIEVRELHAVVYGVLAR